MRVTQSMVYGSFVKDSQAILARMLRQQQEVSSGRRLINPSDDPGNAARLLSLTDESGRVSQQIRNGQEADSFLAATETVLLNLSDILGEVREVVIQANNSTINDQDRFDLGKRVHSALEEIIGLANSDFDGQFLFAGTKNSETPYKASQKDGRFRVEFQGNQERVLVAVSSASLIAQNITGPEVFGAPQRDELFIDGRTGIRPGEGASSGRGEVFIDAVHTETVYSGVSGLAASATSSGVDTILGEHTLNVTQNGQGRTLVLDDGNAVSFNGTETNLVVRNAAGDLVNVDTTSIDPTFNGQVALEGKGTLSVDGGATTYPIAFVDDQTVIDSEKGYRVSVDTREITRTGREDVTFTGTLDIFQVLTSIQDQLQSKTDQGSSERSEELVKLLSELDRVVGTSTRGLASVGSRRERIDITENRLSQLSLTLEAIQSNIRDVDLAEAITKLQQEELSYQAALQSGVQVTRLSILNFI